VNYQPIDEIDERRPPRLRDGRNHLQADPCPKCGAIQQTYSYCTGMREHCPIKSFQPVVKSSFFGGNTYRQSLTAEDSPPFLIRKPEHLDVSCLTCGFVWTRPCLDAKEEAK
jgi:hypothetical protein